MNNRDDKHAKLIAETFHGDWEHGVGATYARAAAASVRRRRLVRRGLVSVAGAVGVALICALVLSRNSALPPAVSASAPEPAVRAYEIISDDELLAQLSDRPILALPDERGHRRITLLDE